MFYDVVVVLRHAKAVQVASSAAARLHASLRHFDTAAFKAADYA